MQRMNGLLHTTSLELVQNNSLHSDPVIGHKRPWSTSHADDTNQDSIDKPQSRFKRSIAIPNAPYKLTPSLITNLEPESLGEGEYTQRHKLAATPSSTLDPELHLSHSLYGLPTQLVENFAALGINHIYPWQRNCLRGPGLLSGERNLVYCAPTGGGKSLVADCKPAPTKQRHQCADTDRASSVLMLKRIINQSDSKALLVLPYVALVQEKVRWLRQLVQSLKFPVSEVKDAQPPFNARPSPGSLRVVGFFGGGKVRASWNDFDIGVCTLEKVHAKLHYFAVLHC